MEKLLFAGATDEVKIPTKADENAGYDIYPNFEEDFLVIQPHATRMIPTGLRSAFSSDYVAILKERGSTGTKGIAQRCGVIDSGFRGEWFIPITNTDSIILVIAKEHISLSEIKDTLCTSMFKVYPYEKAICQAIMVPVPKMEVQKVSVEEILNIKSERGEGQLGSSGK